MLDKIPTFNDGKPISREFFDEHMSGMQNPVVMNRILPQLSYDEGKVIWTEKEKRYEELIGKGLEPMEGLVPLIDFCVRNNLRTAVVTNSPRDAGSVTLKALQLYDHFDGRLVFAEECAHPKPHPSPYLTALELLGVDAQETIAFEDSPSGMKSATSAGILTIGVMSTQSESLLTSHGASLCIKDFTSPLLQQSLAMWVG